MEPLTQWALALSLSSGAPPRVSTSRSCPGRVTESAGGLLGPSPKVGTVWEHTDSADQPLDASFALPSARGQASGVPGLRAVTRALSVGQVAAGGWKQQLGAGACVCRAGIWAGTSWGIPGTAEANHCCSVIILCTQRPEGVGCFSKSAYLVPRHVPHPRGIEEFIRRQNTPVPCRLLFPARDLALWRLASLSFPNSRVKVTLRFCIMWCEE